MDSKNTRKACDLCYRKRIKCDAQRPRCSNCQIYSCECTRDAVSRQKKKKKKPSAPTNSRRQEQQQKQGQDPEQQDLPGTLDLQQQISPVRPSQQSIEQVVDTYIWAERPFLALSQSANDRQDSTLPSHLVSPEPGQRLMELPSENVVRHMIDVYLATFNSMLPLFHPQSLYRTVDDWYRQPFERKQSSSWAAINVVLALAQCFGSEHLNPVVAQTMTVAECLENAQSVLSDVLAGDVDLQNVQILLGLGILFLGAKPGDIRAPMIFVSTAVRLAQAMGMHRRDYYDGTAPLESIQRRRVFWIAYILDKDVAARMRQAPIQHDADMDLDLPPDEATLAAGLDDDDAGFIDVAGCGGQEDSIGIMNRFNMFRARIELAQIQGRVYDCAFSVRARRMEPGESARLAQSIRLSIQQWKARLPASLAVNVLTSQAGNNNVSNLPAVMCQMHSLIIMCLGQLCGVNSMDFQWIENVLSYARGGGDGEMAPSLSPSSLPPPPPPPQGWNVLVSECRDFVRLFQSIRSRHPTLINSQLCPFASSLLCLSVNTFLNFEDSNRLTDQTLMAGAAGILGQVKEQTQTNAVTKVLEVYAELDWHLMLLTTGLVT